MPRKIVGGSKCIDVVSNHGRKRKNVTTEGDLGGGVHFIYTGELAKLLPLSDFWVAEVDSRVSGQIKSQRGIGIINTGAGLALK